MSAQHTLGPWHTNMATLKGRHILVHSANYAVAKVYDEEPGSRPTNEANARLIAAAPELLEAVRLFVSYDDSDDADLSDTETMVRYANAINAARNAISKAEGR